MGSVSDVLSPGTPGTVRYQPLTQGTREGEILAGLEK
jgi:hypothetical protein